MLLPTPGAAEPTQQGDPRPEAGLTGWHRQIPLNPSVPKAKDFLVRGADDFLTAEAGWRQICIWCASCGR